MTDPDRDVVDLLSAEHRESDSICREITGLSAISGRRSGSPR